MKILIFVCALCPLLAGSFGQPNEGVGAFSYQDSTGKRYEGTYGLRNGQVVDQRGNLPPNFSPPDFSPPNFVPLNFPDYENFIPDYFNNLENLLQETHQFIVPPPPPFIRPFRRPFPNSFFRRTFDNVDNQRLAYSAATKAFDLTSNRAGYNPNFSRFPFGGFPGFSGDQGFGRQGFPNIEMPNYGDAPNSAYAGAAITSDYKHQVAGINPTNPAIPNVNKISKVSGSPTGYKSVATFASSVSSDVNGEKHSSRHAETVVDDNGVITKHVVKS